MQTIHTPEVVVFDLGKVLLDFDYSIVARRIAARGAMSVGEIQRFIDHSPLLSRLETGAITRQEFFGEICSTCGYRGALADFERDFADQFSPIEPMIALHGALRAARIPAFVFSNTNEIAIEHIRRAYPFFSDFSGYVLSYEHGVMKPRSEIYAQVERIAERKGNSILYIDDRLENIESGRVRGWQVIAHHTPEETLRIARQLGLPA